MQNGELLSHVSIPNFNPHRTCLRNGDSFMNKTSPDLNELGPVF